MGQASLNPTIIPDIEPEEWAQRILSVFPPDWTSDSAKAEGGVAHGLFKAIGACLTDVENDLIYAWHTCRIATATDDALDSVAADYFGAIAGFPADVVRVPGEPDESLRKRIYANLLCPGATRQALILVLTKLVGTPPRVFEPWRIDDTSEWDGFSYFDIDTTQNPGRMGDPGLSWQGFVETALPPYNSKLGNNPVYAFDMGASWDRSGYFIDPEATWWMQAARLDALINKTKVYGTTVWRRYTQFPLTVNLLGGTENIQANESSHTVTIFPPFAGQYVILASADWNTDVYCIPNSNSTFSFWFGTPAPAAQHVDWMAVPISDPRVGLAGIIPEATTQTIAIPSQYAGSIPIACPSWNTNVRISSISSSSVTFEFSSPAPQKAALAYYFFDVSKGASASVPQDSTQFIVPSIPAVLPYQLFVNPNWNTSVQITKNGSSFVLNFEVPAPSGAIVYWGFHQS